MKFFVIVLCLLSERFLIHASSYARFHWFSSYRQRLLQALPNAGILTNSWIRLFYPIALIMIAVSIALYLFDHILFGFLGLVLNLFVFHYCIGPSNPFYPVRIAIKGNATARDEIGTYLADVNGQLFAVIFWYVLTGPIGLLAYRMTALSKSCNKVGEKASDVTAILDWLPAKLTSLLYLLVGNFQAGIGQFANYFFTPPGDNQLMLMSCGLKAVDYTEDEQMLLPQAETLVEHSVIVLLVFLAFFTMVAWL